MSGTQQVAFTDTLVEPGGDRFVAATALLLAGVLVATQVLAREVIPPLLVFAALYAVLGGAVARWRSRTLRVVMLVLALVHVGGSLPFFAANLAHPESPASFIVEALVLIIGLTLVVGTVMGLRGSGPGSRRPLAVGAGLLAGAAVVVSLAAAAGVASEEPRPGDVQVEVVRSHFPPQVQVDAGGSTLWVDNRDAFHHTLLVEGTGIRVALPARSAVRIDLDLGPGTYRYWCDVPGHDGMEGEIVAG